MLISTLYKVELGCTYLKMKLLKFCLILFLVIMDIQLILGYNGATNNYIPCRQRRINRTYHIDCSNLKLTSVPKCQSLDVPDCTLITEMNLRNNLIEQIRNGSFMQFPNMVLLNLETNPIRMFENNDFKGLKRLESLILRNAWPTGGSNAMFGNETFSYLKNLKLLDISNSDIDVSYLFQTVLCSFPSIETLLMDYVFSFSKRSSFVILDSKMSKCLHHLRLKTLSLNHNRIVEITPEFVLNLRHLEHLSLRYNNILGDRMTIPIVPFIQNLTFFDIGCQNNWRCSEVYIYPPNIPKFGDKNSLVTHIYSKWNGSEIQLLPRLHTLRADHFGGHNPEINIPNICWSNNHLVELDLSYIQVQNMSGTLHCMKYLKYLNLRGIKASVRDPEIFKDLSSLKVLLLGETFTSFNTMLESGRNLFTQNKDLLYLELSQNGIASLHLDIFKNLHQLQFLNLSYNQIQHVGDHFKNLTNLEIVDISYSALTNIPMKIFSVLQRNMKINSSIKGILNITGNPFQCSCTLMSEISMVQRSKVKIIHMNSTQDHLYCFLRNGTRIAFSKIRKQLESVCHVYELTPVIFLTFVYPFSLILITLSTCGYKYLWRVKLAWYTVLHLFYKKKQEKTDFRFDAFISYCSNDEDWVRLKLVANLEKEDNKYKLCLHYRHFLPGRNITDNIAAAIQESRKTVLVVTKKYLKSGWCDFETRFAHSHHLHEHTGGVIGIIHPEVFHLKGARGMALDRLLDSVTYLNWPMEKEQEALFWLKLKKALGPPMTLKAANDDTYNLLLMD